ncbi:MAG: S41 family peptidase [Bryobacteraceae bacterium]
MTLLLLPLLALGLSAQTPIPNSGFEEGAVGEVPTGWYVPKMLREAGFGAATTDQNCRSGAKCAVITGLADAPQNMFGNLMLNVKAEGYTLRRVKLTGAVRVEGANTRAQMWLRLDRADGSMAFLDNMSMRPITSSNWGSYSIEADVPADIDKFALGVMLMGPGKAWVDDMKLEATGTIVKDKVEPARPLTSRGLRNLTAFTKLYGYIRFFHPSDEADRADWETQAVEGVRAVEGAANDEELKAALRKWAEPLGSTIRIGTEAAKQVSEAKEVIRYAHVGVGLPGATMSYNAYSSKRVRKPAGEQRKPYTAELVPGIRAAVPVDLPVDDKGTLPYAPPAPANATYSRVPEDRGTRLASVVIAWNIFQHFYPYFDVVKTDWNAELGKALSAGATDAGPVEFHRTLRRMVAALHDGHGGVNYSSGGMLRLPVTLDLVEGQWVISRAWPGQSDGVAMGDRVVSLDGVPVAKAATEIGEMTSAAGVGWLRWRVAGELAACPAGAKSRKVEVEPFASPGSTKAVELSCVQGKFKDQATYTEPRPEKSKQLEPGIWYVDLDRIDGKDWEALLPELEKAKGIVFDMRGYPGQPGITSLAHLSDNTIRSAKWNIPEAGLPDRTDFVFRESGWPVQPKKPYLPAKRVFLIDGRAISYAETVMGIVEHFKLAEIVGEPTAGTNGNVNPFRLPGGYMVSWTGMKVLKHDGSQHHGIGIVPTVKATRTRKGVAEGKDEVLEKGLEVVKRQLQ